MTFGSLLIERLAFGIKCQLHISIYINNVYICKKIFYTYKKDLSAVSIVTITQSSINNDLFPLWERMLTSPTKVFKQIQLLSRVLHKLKPLQPANEKHEASKTELKHANKQKHLHAEEEKCYLSQ